MSLVACPIRHTANISGMRRQLTALGATPLSEGSLTYALDSGLIELRPVEADDPLKGRAELQFLPDGPAPRGPGLAVLAIQYTTDTTPAIEELTALGAVRRIVADNGVWNDFVCPGGGLAAVHAHTEEDAEEDAEVAFELTGDLGALADALRDAGFNATIVDEAYTRVLQLPDPDGGPAWQINHHQSDLYGFTDLSESAHPVDTSQ